MNNPGKLIVTAAIAIVAGFIVQVVIPYQNQPTHGSGPYLTVTDPLVLKGQEVYRQEGCFYCHTKNLRPFGWEVERFSDSEKLGYFPLEDAVEFQYESPNVKGSVRIGPDLSRVATKMDEASVRELLTSIAGDDADVRTAYHQFSRLFRQEYGNRDGLSLSWRIRAMMQAGFPLNAPFQDASFVKLEGQTRGDALVAYLLSLGKGKMEYAGNYYQ